MRCAIVVTATNAAGNDSATSDPTGAIDAPLRRSARRRRTISGTPTEGETLTLEQRHWTGTEPFTYTYQWRRCDADGSNCVDIAGATERDLRRWLPPTSASRCASS